MGIEGGHAGHATLARFVVSQTLPTQTRHVNVLGETLVSTLNPPFLANLATVLGIHQTNPTTPNDSRVGVRMFSESFHVVPFPCTTTTGPFPMHFRTLAPSKIGNNQTPYVLFPSISLFLLKIFNLLGSPLIQVLHR